MCPGATTTVAAAATAASASAVSAAPSAMVALNLFILLTPFVGGVPGGVRAKARFTEALRLLPVDLGQPARDACGGLTESDRRLRIARDARPDPAPQALGQRSRLLGA